MSIPRLDVRPTRTPAPEAPVEGAPTAVPTAPIAQPTDTFGAALPAPPSGEPAGPPIDPGAAPTTSEPAVPKAPAELAAALSTARDAYAAAIDEYRQIGPAGPTAEQRDRMLALEMRLGRLGQGVGAAILGADEATARTLSEAWTAVKPLAEERARLERGHAIAAMARDEAQTLEKAKAEGLAVPPGLTLQDRLDALQAGIGGTARPRDRADAKRDKEIEGYHALGVALKHHGISIDQVQEFLVTRQMTPELEKVIDRAQSTGSWTATNGSRALLLTLERTTQLDHLAAQIEQRELERTGKPVPKELTDRLAAATEATTQAHALERDIVNNRATRAIQYWRGQVATADRLRVRAEALPATDPRRAKQLDGAERLRKQATAALEQEGTAVSRDVDRLGDRASQRLRAKGSLAWDGAASGHLAVKDPPPADARLGADGTVATPDNLASADRALGESERINPGVVNDPSHGSLRVSTHSRARQYFQDVSTTAGFFKPDGSLADNPTVLAGQARAQYFTQGSVLLNVTDRQIALYEEMRTKGTLSPEGQHELAQLSQLGAALGQERAQVRGAKNEADAGATRAADSERALDIDLNGRPATDGEKAIPSEAERVESARLAVEGAKERVDDADDDAVSDARAILRHREGVYDELRGQHEGDGPDGAGSTRQRLDQARGARATADRLQAATTTDADRMVEGALAAGAALPAYARPVSRAELADIRHLVADTDARYAATTEAYGRAVAVASRATVDQVPTEATTATFAEARYHAVADRLLATGSNDGATPAPTTGPQPLDHTARAKRSFTLLEAGDALAEGSDVETRAGQIDAIAAASVFADQDPQRSQALFQRGGDIVDDIRLHADDPELTTADGDAQRRAADGMDATLVDGARTARGVVFADAAGAIIEGRHDGSILDDQFRFMRARRDQMGAGDARTRADAAIEGVEQEYRDFDSLLERVRDQRRVGLEVGTAMLREAGRGEIEAGDAMVSDATYLLFGAGYFMESAMEDTTNERIAGWLGKARRDHAQAEWGIAALRYGLEKAGPSDPATDAGDRRGEFMALVAASRRGFHGGPHPAHARLGVLLNGAPLTPQLNGGLWPEVPAHPPLTYVVGGRDDSGYIDSTLTRGHPVLLQFLRSGSADARPFLDSAGAGSKAHLDDNTMQIYVDVQEDLRDSAWQDAKPYIYINAAGEMLLGIVAPQMAAAALANIARATTVVARGVSTARTASMVARTGQLMRAARESRALVTAGRGLRPVGNLMRTGGTTFAQRAGAMTLVMGGTYGATEASAAMFGRRAVITKMVGLGGLFAQVGAIRPIARVHGLIAPVALVGAQFTATHVVVPALVDDPQTQMLVSMGIGILLPATIGTISAHHAGRDQARALAQQHGLTPDALPGVRPDIEARLGAVLAEHADLGALSHPPDGIFHVPAKATDAAPPHSMYARVRQTLVDSGVPVERAHEVAAQTATFQRVGWAHDQARRALNLPETFTAGKPATPEQATALVDGTAKRLIDGGMAPQDAYAAAGQMVGQHLGRQALLLGERRNPDAAAVAAMNKAAMAATDHAIAKQWLVSIDAATGTSSDHATAMPVLTRRMAAYRQALEEGRANGPEHVKQLRDELDAAGVRPGAIAALLTLEVPRAIQEGAQHKLAGVETDGVPVTDDLARIALLTEAKAFETAGLLQRPADAPPGRSAAEIYVERLLGIGGDAQLANVDPQNTLQGQQQLLEMLSNIFKSQHDTAMGAIRQMEGPGTRAVPGHADTDATGTFVSVPGPQDNLVMLGPDGKLSDGWRWVGGTGRQVTVENARGERMTVTPEQLVAMHQLRVGDHVIEWNGQRWRSAGLSERGILLRPAQARDGDAAVMQWIGAAEMSALIQANPHLHGAKPAPDAPPAARIFRPEQPVRVERTGGRVEDGWVVDHIRADGTVIVRNDAIGKVKPVPADLLARWQGLEPPGGQPAPRFAVDQEVLVRRTNGDVERWKVGARLDDGSYLVTDASGRLSKPASEAELTAWQRLRPGAARAERAAPPPPARPIARASEVRNAKDSPAAQISNRFVETHRLGPGDRIPDGYVDGGRYMATDASGGDVVFRSAGRELLTVDRGHRALRGSIEFAQSLRQHRPPLGDAEIARRLAVHVDDLLSAGLRGKPEAIDARTEAGLGAHYGKVVSLGDVIEAGAGVCRHRALLFKILADEVGLQTSMVRGTIMGRAHAWNEVTLSGQRHIVDTMMNTGDGVGATMRADEAPFYVQYTARAAPREPARIDAPPRAGEPPAVPEPPPAARIPTAGADAQPSAAFVRSLGADHPLRRAVGGLDDAAQGRALALAERHAPLRAMLEGEPATAAHLAELAGIDGFAALAARAPERAAEMARFADEGHLPLATIARTHGVATAEAVVALHNESPAALAVLLRKHGQVAGLEVIKRDPAAALAQARDLVRAHIAASDPSGSLGIRALTQAESEAVVTLASFANRTGDNAIDAATLRRMGLEPRYQVQVDGQTYYLTDPFALPGGRHGMIGFVEHDGVISARMFYRSNSQSAWRVSDASLNGHFGKGLGEVDTMLPIRFTALAHRMAAAGLEPIRAPADRAIATDQGKSGGRLFQRIARDAVAGMDDGDVVRHSHGYATKDYQAHVAESDVAVAGHGRDLVSPSGHSVQDPASIKLGDPKLRPDFARAPIDEFSFYSQSMQDLIGDGRLRARVYPSRDGTIHYLLIEDAGGRVSIVGAEIVQGEGSAITPFGNRARYLDLHGNDGPLFEYGMQIAREYGGDRSDEYRMNWSYVRDLPLIQEYYAQRGIPMPEALPESATWRVTPAFDEAMKQVGGTYTRRVITALAEKDPGVRAFVEQHGAEGATLLVRLGESLGPEQLGILVASMPGPRQARLLALADQITPTMLQQWHAVEPLSVRAEHALASLAALDAPTVPPARPLQPPPERHAIHAITRTSHPDSRNTVIEPSVDVAADVQAINNGEARLVNGRYVINGRVYGQQDGALYPISGPGFMQLSRATYTALSALNSYGDTPRAHAVIDKMFAHLPESEQRIERALALRAYRAAQRGRT